MPADARTCSGCGALQWFRGYLHISQTTLSLVVALISSLTALGAVMANLVPARSERHVYFQALASSDEGGDTAGRRFWVLVTNTGKRPVGVQSATLYIKGAPKRAIKIVEPAVAKRSVGSGESLMVELELPGWTPADFSLSSRSDSGFKGFLERGHGLDVTISGYGDGGQEKKRIEGMPDKVLAALLCRSASSTPGEETDLCREWYRDVLEGV
jgi:hypothetical protein